MLENVIENYLDVFFPKPFNIVFDRLPLTAASYIIVMVTNSVYANIDFKIRPVF